MELSILDFGHIGTSVELVQEADRLGFARFWLGEHHSQWQCGNPLLLGALLAAATDGIRIGSGGVCLSYQSPYRIAEDARLIEYMVPGRFDLGVARGLTLEPGILHAMLDGRPEETLREHYEKLADLHGFLTGRLAGGAPPGLATALPLESGPPMWVLGTSAAAASWAGRHGTGFCFSLHHAGTGQNQPEVLAEYRRQFVPSPEFPLPAAIVVATVVCGPTVDAALAIAASLQHAKVTVAGTAAECAERLQEIAHRFGADEMMLLDLLPGHAHGLREHYAELAAGVGLAPRDPAPV